MTRLIIIGNGFDIAHGMPTRYSDFVKWYLTNLFIRLGKEDFEDESIRASENIQTGTSRKENSELLIKIIESDNTEQNVVLETILNNEHGKISSQNFNRFFIDFKFPILKDIFLFYLQKNWVDIENLFYKTLVNLAVTEGMGENRNKQVDLLNKGMNYLKDKLEEYLATLPLPNAIPGILKIINSDVKLKEISKNKNDVRNQTPSEIVFLNFNYTKTITNYLDSINKRATKYNNIYIHGEMQNYRNPLIFGFGDEMDDHYKVLEKTNYNGFLDNMKAFGYSRTGNYQDLSYSINSFGSFEVFIMGHSCGLSDRVMLNMIFEHPNCKSIKIYYHGDEKSNNYKTITQEISRHFNKKNEMRLKLVPFEDSIPLPQSS